MAVALMIHKESHTPDELRQLAEAPYFGSYLVQVRKPVKQGSPGRRKNGRSPEPQETTDSDFLPAGTPIRSHGIAPSTRRRFERLVETELPTVSEEKLSDFMEARKLRTLLKKHPELGKDSSVGELYQLLTVVSKLGFRVGWYEDLQEKAPKGWR